MVKLTRSIRRVPTGRNSSFSFYFPQHYGSGRRRSHRRRPPTPPYERFRIRRFMKSTEDSALATAATKFDLCCLQRSPASEQSVLSLPWPVTHPSLPLANSVGYLRVGFKLLGSSFCVFAGHRNAILRPVLQVRAFAPVERSYYAL